VCSAFDIVHRPSAPSISRISTKVAFLRLERLRRHGIVESVEQVGKSLLSTHTFPSLGSNVRQSRPRSPKLCGIKAEHHFWAAPAISSSSAAAVFFSATEARNDACRPSFAFWRLTKMAKRELLEPKPGDKRYVRRDDKGHFAKEQDDVGRSLTQDRRKEAKHEAPRGQGDRGDRKSASK